MISRRSLLVCSSAAFASQLAGAALAAIPGLALDGGEGGEGRDEAVPRMVVPDGLAAFDLHPGAIFPHPVRACGPVIVLYTPHRAVPPSVAQANATHCNPPGQRKIFLKNCLDAGVPASGLPLKGGAEKWALS